MTELFLATFLSIYCCDVIWNGNWFSWERAGSKLSAVVEECLWVVIIQARKVEEKGQALRCFQRAWDTRSLWQPAKDRTSSGERDSGRRGKMWRRKGLRACYGSLWGCLRGPSIPCALQQQGGSLSYTWPPKDVSQWLGTILHLPGPSYLYISSFCGILIYGRLDHVPVLGQLLKKIPLSSDCHKITPNRWTINFTEGLCTWEEKEPQPHTSFESMSYPQGQTYHLQLLVFPEGGSC